MFVQDRDAATSGADVDNIGVAALNSSPARSGIENKQANVLHLFIRECSFTVCRIAVLQAFLCY